MLRPTIVADTRERAVIPFLEDALAAAGHELAVKQINTGDYLVIAPQGAVLACVERKTHEDYAASLKDGRSANIQKMRDLRARTGCQLFYFIEGPAFPSPNRRFARIPYSSILTSITNLMIRDQVFIIQTEDQSHTAQRLVDLVRSFHNVAAPPALAPQAEPAAPAPEALAPQAEPAAPGGAVQGGMEDLTCRIAQTDAAASAAMWARLNGVTLVQGKLLSREFSPASAVSTPDEARLRALRSATGRAIAPAALRSLMALSRGEAAPLAKMMSGINGITEATAACLIAGAGGPLALVGASAESLAEIMIPQKTRPQRFGAARAERVQRLLQFTCAR